MVESGLYGILNKEWKTTCRILFGEELGELKEYEEWLKEYLPPIGKRVSHVSGKEVTLVTDYYSPNARFVSSDEITEKAIEPLTINEIKDIDSIVEAISEKWEYTGNRILGNSAYVESSDVVVDSRYVLDSVDITESAYIFGSSLVRRGSKYSFGSHFFGQGEFLVRVGAAFNAKRVFESILVGDSSDIYFSHNCMGCNELLFSFFQRNKRYCIGNLQLPKEKYLSLKKKILQEVVEELKKSKRFPSIFKLVSNEKPPAGITIPTPKKEENDMGPIEKAFSSTFRIILNKEAYGIQNYEKWLSKYLMEIKEIRSPFGHPVFTLEGNELRFFSMLQKKRMVSFYEGLELGKRHLDEADLVSLNKIIERLPEIAFFTVELIEGEVRNVIKSPIVYHGSHAYKTYDLTYGEYSGVSSMSLNSKYTFGCYRILESQFCINCYNSLYLTRCFEVDTSTKCSDSLFCHNSEALQDCAFCFNAKGKRHAIGNLQLPPEQYRKIKNMLVEQMTEEILKNKELKYDIFNIGCGKK